MICHNCENEFPEGSSFCTNCGVPVNAQYTAQPLLVGFSDVYNHPEIIAAGKKDRKSSMGCMWILFFIPLTGFSVAGIFIESFPFKEAVIIGAVISLLILVIGLVMVRDSKKPMWEGTVTDKRNKKKVETVDDKNITHMLYTVEIRTDSGKKKVISEKDSDRCMYDYLAVGDRLRYHPAFGTYEKYDKSKDRNVYCNVCSTLNPIKNDRCKKCNNLLFK